MVNLISLSRCHFQFEAAVSHYYYFSSKLPSPSSMQCQFDASSRVKEPVFFPSKQIVVVMSPANLPFQTSKQRRSTNPSTRNRRTLRSILPKPKPALILILTIP